MFWCWNVSFAVLPKSVIFFKPSKSTFHYPAFRYNFESMQITFLTTSTEQPIMFLIASTNKVPLYPESTYLNFDKIISIGNKHFNSTVSISYIGFRHINCLRQTENINIKMKFYAGKFFAHIIFAVSVFLILFESTMTKVVCGLRPQAKR